MVKSVDGAKKSSIKKDEVTVNGENKETVPTENGLEQQQNEEKSQTTSQTAEGIATVNATETTNTTLSEKLTKEEKRESDTNKIGIPEPRIERRKSGSRKGSSRRNVDLFTEIDDQKLCQLKEVIMCYY